MKFENIALNVPEVLLPLKNIDMTKWAVVACDQYTSELDYWTRVEEFVGNNPSTLNLIFPEVYLEAKGKEERIKNINESMHLYLKNKLLTSKNAFILVDRQTNHVKSRKGLVVALDLDQYDFTKGSKTLIRATEGTIIERLPPRIKVREHAEIELPHVMVLIDDPQKTVIEPLFNENLETAYDFDLMMNSGHIKGYYVEDEKIQEKIAQSISLLANKETFNSKYNLDDEEVLLYAVGDGNHSLATAKSIWEELKKTGVTNSPARYALVELVNVHDEGLEFKPIHRVLFEVNARTVLDEFKHFVESEGSTFEILNVEGFNELQDELLDIEKGIHKIPFCYEGTYGLVVVSNPKRNLEVGTLQAFLDAKVAKDKIDYIHGEDVVKSLSSKSGNMGFLLPVMSKHELFRTVLLDGALPRKTFSMGEADEKRFYLEARKIK